MKIDRRDLKWRAREAMRTADPDARFMTFLYLLLTTGLTGVIGWFMTDPLGEVLNLYQQGVMLERAIPLMLLTVGRLGLFLSIFMAVYGVVMDFGYRRWCLRTARGERGEPGDLFGGFAMVGRILWLQVLILLYGFLWYLAIFMPAVVGVVLGLLIPLVGPLVCVAVFLLAIGLWIARVARYAMATYCLADEPELGAARALRRSSRMMQGNVGGYVLLMLSFVGWFLLGGLIVTTVEAALMLAVGGVRAFTDPQIAQVIGSSMLVSVLTTVAVWPLDVWLKPYVTVTECEFYETIKGEGEHATL